MNFLIPTTTKTMEVKYFEVNHKNTTRQMPVLSGKNQNHKSQFSGEFCSVEVRFSFQVGMY
jgi:hypothetical protein